MQENTNKAIVINSFILYTRLIISAICGLFSTRFALQALGANDFGLFSVIASLISFIAIINTIMVSTSNRFIATAIGRGSLNDINEQFNVNLIVHAVIAFAILIMAIPIGHWYINNYFRYEGSLGVVLKIFDLTILGSVISIIAVPYNGLLMAKERFLVFCSTDIVSHILLVLMSYFLLDHFSDKLMIYAWTKTVLAAYPTLIFFIYCTIKFKEIVRFRFVKTKAKYRQVLSFSVWVGYGALATVGKSQGAALLVNAFFSTVMNTALGIANAVNSIILNFANNVSKSISPQITKSYAGGDMDRSMKLVCMSSRYSFLLMLLVSSPFFVAPNYILGLWLGEVPNYATIFTVLVVVDGLIGALNAGIPEIIFASGKIKWYQIIVNTLFLLSIIVAYFVLKAGAAAYFLQITYIAFSIIVLIVRQIVLNKVVRFDNIRLIRESYFPSFIVVILFIPCCFIPLVIHPLLQLLLCELYLLFIIFTIGLSKIERELIVASIKKRL